MTITPPWTDARVDLLVGMRADGCPFSEIAAALGISRNAAIGKASRLGLSGANRNGPRRSTKRRHSKSAPASSLAVRDAAHPPAQTTVQAVNQTPSGRCEGYASTVLEGSLGAVVACDGAKANDAVVAGGRAKEIDAVVACDGAEKNVRLPGRNQPPVPPAPTNPPVALMDVKGTQCRFPIWTHKAGPGDPDYGMLCGAPIEAPSHATKRGAKARPSETPHYCAHHKHVCAARPPETRKADRQAEQATSLARHRGVA